MSKPITVNMVSESDITVQGHGVHTAYDELAQALEARQDVAVIRGEFGKTTPCDVVHIHTIGPRVWRKLFQRGPKKIMSVHVIPASFIGSIALSRYWLPIARLYMRWIYGKADVLLAVSTMVARSLTHELHLPPEKIHVFYNTIAMDRYKPNAEKRQIARKKLGIEPDAFVVIGNGQVQPRKHPEVFVKAATALPTVQFIWIGGLPFGRIAANAAAMKRLMDAPPATMKFTGIIPHKEVADYLAAADVFCLPAEQENHPMCVLEAAGAGLPIVLRDINEYHDTFGTDAVLCKTTQDFIDAFAKLQTDHEFYQETVHKSQAIRKRFDSSRAAQTLVSDYYQPH